MSLQTIVSDTIRKFGSYVNCDIPVPSYLCKQVNAIFEMEEDYENGLAHLLEGVQDEADCLEVLLNE
jgi:hypothetical protein